MADEQRAAMSEAEREVLKVLWDLGALGVRDLAAALKERGQDWSRSTVITLLQRLEKKGYVGSDRSRFAFVFRPLVTRNEVMLDRMTDLAGEFCDGAAMPLVLAFAERYDFSPEELARFRAMIDALEARQESGGEQ